MNKNPQIKIPSPISPHMWESIITNSTDVIMIVDVAGTIHYINQTIAGVDLEDTLGRNVREYFPSDQGDALTERLRRVFETGEPESEEVYAAGPMNSNAWYLSRVAPVSHNGHTIALSIAATDITALKTAQKVSSDAESRLHSILNNVAYGIISINDRGSIESVNNAVERMFGYAAKELLGINIILLMSDKYANHYDGYLSNHSKTGRMNVTSDTRELEGQRKDGSVFPLELTVTEFTQNDGVMYTGILVDITQRKQTEIELLQSQKMEAIGLLAGGVAHDFNNMLSAIMSYTYLINHRVPEDSDVSRYGEEIQKAADRAAGLTRQLLTFSRRDLAGLKTVNPGTVLDQLVKMIRHIIPENIQVICRPAPDLWTITVDVGQLEQVILNLAINARDALPEGGEINLELSNSVLDDLDVDAPRDSRSGEYVILSVSDNGVGMTPEIKNRIFEPFFTTKESGKGTGLGLSTCYGIVKQMSGHITVDSTPELGSTFRIYIPRTHDPIKSNHENTLQDSELTGSGTILFVEDEVILHDMAVLTLREFGYTVLTALNGSDALTVASEHTGPIDLLLTDVIMPQMGGLELFANLKVTYPEMRVLYTSGYVDDPKIRQIISAKQDNFLRKPYTLPQLLRQVRKVCAHSTQLT